MWVAVGDEFFPAFVAFMLRAVKHVHEIFALTVWADRLEVAVARHMLSFEERLVAENLQRIGEWTMMECITPETKNR